MSEEPFTPKLTVFIGTIGAKGRNFPLEQESLILAPGPLGRVSSGDIAHAISVAEAFALDVFGRLSLKIEDLRDKYWWWLLELTPKFSVQSWPRPVNDK